MFILQRIMLLLACLICLIAIYRCCCDWSSRGSVCAFSLEEGEPTKGKGEELEAPPPKQSTKTKSEEQEQ